MKSIKACVSLLALNLLLTGCVPVALVAGATVGGAIIYDNRTIKQINIDNEITQQVNLLLNNNLTLKNKTHISISAYNGIVLLVGQTPTPELRDQAYNLVKSIKHIHRIYNELTISGPSSALQRANDSWITTKVKSNMITISGLHSTNIRVVTENSTVYLMGRVSYQQAKAATNAARTVDGVQKVVKVFEHPH